MAKRRYLTLVETYMRRFQRGGFLVGDVLKFNKNFKSDSSYQKLGSNVKELIDQMIDSKLHIRVIGIKNQVGGWYPGNPDTSDINVTLDIALDDGGGRYSHFVSIPPSIVEPLAFYPNLPPIPRGIVKEYPVDIKPKELETDDNAITNITDPGTGKLRTTEYKLDNKNTTIPSEPATSSPEVNSYTKDYLKGLTECE
jgi:hypothetical protein